MLVAAIDTAARYAPSRSIVYNRKLLRRIAWDGLQEIAEIQVQDTSVVAIAEMDTGRVAVTRSSDGTDNNSQYGQALFTFGGGAIDQPLSVTRVNYADASDSAGNSLPYFQWPVISIVPLWNMRGRWDTAIFPEYYVTDQGGTLHSLKYNLQIGWQSYALYPPGPQLAWHGDVLNGKQNETGTVYKRARVYDPATGQFTQEDPIGMAGGLNAYGFANGDPLNYDDPFGMCPVGQINTAQRNAPEKCVKTNAPRDPGLESPGLLDPTLLIGGLEEEGAEAAIKITDEALEHVVDSHTVEGIANAGKSIFVKGENLVGLIRRGESAPAVKQAFGRNYQRIVNAGRHIGVDRATGQATSIYTIITNAANELRTMFPGTP